ncbi:hypothetical protein Ddc_11617 [Ditylenchus destructor]|nr:hypothetical protein Ddc_11617 [Ditylenchus destructor]
MNDNALQTIQEIFLASKDLCFFRMIVRPLSMNENMEFHLENNRTKEELRLKYITRQEAKENFDVSIGVVSMILERLPL